MASRPAISVAAEQRPAVATQLATAVAEWVTQTLEAYSYHSALKVRAPKLIRDGLWDSHLFQPFEVHVLDSPILQRLRWVSQTALTQFVYPSATHTRFQHTLGTVIVLDRLLAAVTAKLPVDERELLDPSLVRHLRLAALLHDVGHGVFSHASESYYGQDPGLQWWRSHLRKRGGSAKAHEVLSYLIVTSEPFRDFMDEVMAKYDVPVLDLQHVGDMIVGCSTTPLNDYMRDLINGVFDVDKLDYISRDAYSTGIKMVLDLDRLA